MCPTIRVRSRYPHSLSHEIRMKNVASVLSTLVNDTGNEQSGGRAISYLLTKTRSAFLTFFSFYFVLWNEILKKLSQCTLCCIPGVKTTLRYVGLCVAISIKHVLNVSYCLP